MYDGAPPPVGGHGLHLPSDGKLILPPSREYDHFGLHKSGKLVFDWPEPVTAVAAYDHIYNAPLRIQKAVTVHGVAYGPAMLALGEHLAEERFEWVTQIQIDPIEVDVLVFGSVAEGEVVASGEVRQQDIDRAEQIARAKRERPASPLTNKHSGAVGLPRVPKKRTAS